MSDRVIYLNRFLARFGLLTYRKTNQSAVSRAKQQAIRRVYKVLSGTLGPKQKKFLSGALPGMRERFEGAYTSFANIDWTATVAHCSEVLASPPCIWINRRGEKPSGIVSEEEYEPLLARISEKLSELRDPRTGEPIIRRVYRRDELFQGPLVKEAPDLILDWWSPEAFSMGPSFPEGSDKPVVQILPRKPVKASEWGGTHRKDGVFIAKGEAFNRGARIEGARLIDFAPTLLYLLGKRVPEDMDGSVLTQPFDPQFLKRHAVAYEKSSETPGTGNGNGTYSAEEAAQIEARLQALGYID